QRVAIARALVNKPTLILADEPTGNLDSERTEEVLTLLCDFNEREGQTFILVTHEPDVAAACHRIIRMRDGKIREETRTSERTPDASTGLERASAADRVPVLSR
ncbi:MAG: macrolide ABC transporter permease/ATP-binding protein MacB, partial [Aeromicrobium sp.]